MKSDLAFFEKKKLTVMKSNDGKYENKRFKSSRSRGGVPLFCHIRKFFLVTLFEGKCVFFRIFMIFSSKFRKNKISRDSGGVRSSALDMLDV